MPVRASKTLRARGAVAVLAVATALSLGACGTGQAGAALVWGQTVITQAELVDGYADLRDHVLGEEYIGDIGPTLIAFFAGFVRENAAALEQAGVVMPSEAEGEAWIGQQVAAVNEQRGQSGLAPLESVEHHTPLVVDFGRWYILSEQATAGEIDSTVFNTIFESLSMDPTIAQFNPRFGILDLQTSQAVSPLAYPWTIGTGLGDATEEQ